MYTTRSYIYATHCFGIEHIYTEWNGVSSNSFLYNISTIIYTLNVSSNIADGCCIAGSLIVCKKIFFRCGVVYGVVCLELILLFKKKIIKKTISLILVTTRTW